MTSIEKIKCAVNALDEKKAGNIRIIEVKEISSFADYFIIADGKNKNQLQALCDNVQDSMQKMGLEIKNKEGNSNGGWILLDYYDIIIHVFSDEAREFYDLEHIWNDGNIISPGEL